MAVNWRGGATATPISQIMAITCFRASSVSQRIVSSWFTLWSHVISVENNGSYENSKTPTPLAPQGWPVSFSWRRGRRHRPGAPSCNTYGRTNQLKSSPARTCDWNLLSDQARPAAAAPREAKRVLIYLIDGLNARYAKSLVMPCLDGAYFTNLEQPHKVTEGRAPECRFYGVNFWGV